MSAHYFAIGSMLINVDSRVNPQNDCMEGGLIDKDYSVTIRVIW